jgi:hypothetical protein
MPDRLNWYLGPIDKKADFGYNDTVKVRWSDK